MRKVGAAVFVKAMGETGKSVVERWLDMKLGCGPIYIKMNPPRTIFDGGLTVLPAAGGPPNRLF